MSHILVTGADGQLGREIKKIRNRYSHSYSFTDIKELDLTDAGAISAYLAAQPADYIINCAAYTDVDKAETDKEQAMRLNRDAVANLVHCLKEYPGTRMIHISTDYVYKDDKNRPLMEEDATEPSSVYGITKLEGDKILLNHPRALVIRTSWLFSVFGKNFVKSMINRMDQRSDLKVVYDQVGTPTYAEDLAQAIMQIISDVDSGKKDFTPGIFHYSNEGICSWYDLAIAVCRLINCSGKVIPVETHEFPTPAPRPAYSVLNKSKIKRVYEVKVPYWRDSLEQCIKNLL
ncbi:MAG: dTDP-4-dehydrorhamnose reductase [Bacteroidales bacterium]|nr:dTDP-4-dehydrorhamnose reductase [Bacteroidales bacterium]